MQVRIMLILWQWLLWKLLDLVKASANIHLCLRFRFSD